MGYTKNQAAIQKVEKFLTLMVETDENLEWETADPSKLAYYIREGISVSGLVFSNEPDNDRLKDFSKLKAKFILKVKGNKVIASLRSEIPLAVYSVKRLKSVHLPNIINLVGIIGAIATYIVKENKEQITLPNASLNKDEFEKLEKYLVSKDLNIKVNGNEIVISKETKDVEV